MSLARANILHELRRFLAACSVLCLSALLVYLFAGPLIAQLESVGKIEKHFEADLIVSKDIGDDTEKILMASLGLSYTQLSEQIDLVLLGHPEVETVQAAENSRRIPNWKWQWSDDYFNREQVYVFDMSETSLGYPQIFGSKLRQALATPMTVALFEPLAAKYNVSIGETIQVDQTLLTVVGIIPPPYIGLSGSMVSDKTAALIEPKISRTDLYLIKLKAGSNISKVKSELAQQLTRYQTVIHTPHELAISLGRSFLAANMKGIIVGNFVSVILISVITGLTLKSLLLSYRDEFACLRALGINKFQMAAIAVETSIWVAVVSILSSIIGAWLIKTAFVFYEVPFQIPVSLVVTISSVMFFISALSGAATLPSLLKISPSELLR